MNYGHIVIANSKKGIMPSIIRFFTGSKYSHSLITVPSVLEVPMCIEAAENGVSYLRFDRGYTENADQDIRIFDVLVDQKSKDAAIVNCLDYLETSYGFLELPWFMWRAINAKFGRDIKKNSNWAQGGTICSELCVVYLMHCGLGDLFKDFGQGSVNAQDVLNIMLSRPDLFREVK